MTHAKPSAMSPDHDKVRGGQEESDKQRRRNADLDAATQPASGASVSAAFAGASLAASEDDSETEKSLKKAAKNDRGGK